MKNKFFKIIIILVVFLSLIGCTEEKKEEKKVTIHKMEEKDLNTQIKELIDQGNYIIVDVRTKAEYDQSHIKGSINIEYDKIDENVKLDKDKLIMVYCKSGKRSTTAYNTLKGLGYNVFNMGAFENINLEKE